MANGFGELVVGTSVPAVRGYFGGNSPEDCRVQYFQTSLRATQVKGILGHDPRSKGWKKLADPKLREMYEYLQRATEPDRALGLEDYIDQRLRPNPITAGAFPGIAIGICDPVFWDKADSPVGTLQIPVESRRVLLDGLGRLTAVLNFIEPFDTDRPSQPEVNQWFTFPVTIYAPPPKGKLTIEDLGQLFFDFNFRQKQVKKSKAMTVDKSDLHIRMTNALADRPEGVIARNGGMNRKGLTLGGNAKELVTQPHLLKFVRGAFEGRAAQDSDKLIIHEPNLRPQNFRELEQKLESFLKALENRMGDRFAARDEYLHFSSIGWQILGLIFHALEFEFAERMSDTDRMAVLDRLGRVDWSRHNPDLIAILGEPKRDYEGRPILDDQGRQTLDKFTKLGRQTKEALKKYVWKATGLDQFEAAPTEIEELVAVE